jgi:type IV fimbrial biogenesis protein FimT
VKYYQRGVTLVELLTVVVLVAILGSIGIPSFRQTLLNQQSEAQRDTLVNSVVTARQSARRFSLPISVCSTQTGLVCGGVNDWSNG